MPGVEITLTATRFKATCLRVFDQLEQRRLTRVITTRRGKPVAELRPPSEAPRPLWGAHPGSVTVTPGVDLTELVLDEALDAESAGPGR